MAKKKDGKFVRAVGRPSTLSDEVMQQIANAIRIGMYVETACALNGVPRATMNTWLIEGRKERRANADNARWKPSLRAKFSHILEQAVAEAEARDLAVLDKAANGRDAEYERDVDGRIARDSEGDPILKRPAQAANWNAAAWRLERRFPKRWGNRGKMEIENTGNAPTVPQVVIEIPSNGREVRALVPGTEEYKAANAKPEGDLDDDELPT